MEQFRQIGEVMGSLKALMVLKHDISINQKQCCLLYDILEFAFATISEEIRQNLRLEEKSIKWKALEHPMKDLHRVFKEADLYVRHCIDMKDWWGRAISLHMNRDCVELHIHNLLTCFPVVIEAIEAAAEISGVDQDDMHKKRTALMKKYDQEWTDPKLFHWKFGKQYLVPREICSRLDTAWNEDRWFLLEKVREKKMSADGEYSSKEELRLGEVLLRKLNDAETTDNKILPSHILVGAQDYLVRRRLGQGCPSGGGHSKEIHWLGENFALRTFYGDIETFHSDISSVLSLSHPNVMQHLCAFYDDDRKEGFLVMELMSKDLDTYIREHSGQRKRIPFTIPVAVDLMLQIARGMEYLHSKKIYHGDLSPCNILLKARNPSTEGLFLVKITGFGLNSIKSRSPRPNGGDHFDIWLAPEVLAELEKGGGKSTAKYTEKADVYSFGMLCFELLTGKIPFQDCHLKGEKMVRNIRAGERPLFSYPSPKYLANFTRKCWQTNPNLRPSFSSICRILRYIKKILVINPDHGDPDSPPPLVDYCDMEAGYLKKFPEGTSDLPPVSQIPFQMFAYRVIEREKINGRNWDLPLDGVPVRRAESLCDEDHLAAMDDMFLVPSDWRSFCSEIIDTKTSAIALDLRSVISEIPHRKFFSSDQRSFKSESPRKRFSTFAADQRSITAETPERKHSTATDKADKSSPNFQTLIKKMDQKLRIQKPNVEVPDKAGASKAEMHQPANPMPPVNSKFAVTKVTDQNSEITGTGEKKLIPRTTVDNKPAISDSLGLKSSTWCVGHHKLAEIPEKRTLQNTESNKKIVSTTSAKKDEATTKSIQRSGNTIKSETKSTMIKKLKNTMTKSVPETLRNDSPTSTPAKKKTANPIIASPASSPGRTFKPSAATPKHTTSALKDYSSPVHSQLHACARCSRLSRQTTLPDTNTQRAKIDNV